MNKRIFASLLSLGIAFLAYSQTEQTIPDSLKSFSSHLEFLGYSVTSASDKSVSMNHSKYPNERILIYSGGVLLTSLWTVNEAGKSEGSEISLFVNELNNKSVVTKYYLDDDKDLVLEAWFPGEYDKTKFALFVNKIQQDWDNTVKNHQAELKKYLK